MGLFDWFTGGSGTPPAGQSAGTDSFDEDTTRVDRPDFTLNLPFRWNTVAASEGYEFRNQTLPEQILVTVLQPQRLITGNELQAILVQLVAARTNAIAEMSSGTALLGETDFRRGASHFEARVVGVDQANGVRLAFLICVSPWKSLTVALNRYTLREIGTPFVEYAGIIFDLFEVKDA